MTRELSSEIDTCGVGAKGETGIAEGFLERSTMLKRIYFSDSGGYIIVCDGSKGRGVGSQKYNVNR